MLELRLPARAGTGHVSLCCGLRVLVNFYCLVRFFAPVDDGADSLDHTSGAVGLEDVAAHVYAGSTLVNGPIGHIQCF